LENQKKDFPNFTQADMGTTISIREVQGRGIGNATPCTNLDAMLGFKLKINVLSSKIAIITPKINY